MRKEKQKRKKQVKIYRVYTEFLGLVFQMCAIIILGVLLGQFLDDKILPNSKTPWFTILGAIFSLTLAMYLMIKKSK